MYQGRQLTNAEKGAIISGVLDLAIGTVGIFYPDPKIQQELLLISGILTAVLAVFGIIVATRANSKQNEARMREIAGYVALRGDTARGLADPKLTPPIDENPAEWVVFAEAIGWKGREAVKNETLANQKAAARSFVLGKYRLMDRKTNQ